MIETSQGPLHRGSLSRGNYCLRELVESGLVVTIASPGDVEREKLAVEIIAKHIEESVTLAIEAHEKLNKRPVDPERALKEFFRGKKT